MKPDAEQVMAYVDGELDAPARSAFEAALAQDAELRAAVQRERALRGALAAAYDPVLDEPVPAALQAALAAPNAVVDLAAARQARATRIAPRWQAWRWPEWGAMAACLALGTAFGLWGLAPGGSGVEEIVARRADGTLVASGGLDRMLTSTLAADAPASGGLAVGLSFAARDGRYCRVFSIDAGAATAGLACRDGAAWQLQALAPSEAASAPPGAYRQAATALPRALLPVVERLRDGEALDAAGERAARDRGWRR